MESSRISSYLVVLLTTTTWILCFTSAAAKYQLNVTQNDEARELYWAPPPPCGVINFSVYNLQSNSFTELYQESWGMLAIPLARIHMQYYPNGRINIIANTDTSDCMDVTINCVSMTFGAFYETISKSAPFALYGKTSSGQLLARRPAQTGHQILTTKAYSTLDCTGTPLNEVAVKIQLVPKTTQTFIIPPFTATYSGTEGLEPKAADTKAMITASCSYISSALENGFTYRGSLSFDRNSFKCRRIEKQQSSSSMNSPLQITYQLITTFYIRYDISIYGNPDMPTNQGIAGFIHSRFLNQGTDSPFSNQAMWEVVHKQLEATNPYSHFTAVTLG
jgi:hypothetical protein